MEKNHFIIQKNTIKKVILLMLGMVGLSAGIVLNTKSQLGVGSITTVPYVFSLITQLTLGQSITLLYFIFVCIQTLLLKKIDLKIILQFPFSFLVGYCIDICDNLIIVEPTTLLSQVIILIVATLLTALGVYLMIKGDIVLNPSDGIVQTIAYVMNQPFGRVKVIFDISMVILSGVICLLVFHTIDGIGIGTISNALLIGYCIAFYDRLLKLE